MSFYRSIFFTFLFGVFILSACKEEKDDVMDQPTNQEIISSYLDLDLANPPNYASHDYPVHYTAVLNRVNTPEENTTTDKGASLGRVLFYDTQLSLNNSTSCATCHEASIGFTDMNRFSEGFDGGHTPNHSMRLANAVFYEPGTMFWDKRASSLEDQATQPIKDHLEMGFSEENGGISALLERMSTLEYYPPLFEYVFGSSTITEEKIQHALAQFIRSMVSTGSAFDEGFAQVYQPNLPGNGIGQAFPNYTVEENRGKDLFTLPPDLGGFGCAGCHQPPTFALDGNSLSNGLYVGENIIFKSPSLKNVALKGPYMHDGSLETLDDVLEHYSTGILPGPSLDIRLRTRNGQPLRLNMTDQEKSDLLAFLHTLDDPNVCSDEKFGNPF